jgi:P pilus assembly chaperone PapD
VNGLRESIRTFASHLLGFAALLLWCIVLVTMRESHGADFAVSPMSLELARGARSGEIQVRNLDQQPIRFQIRGADWTQDESGKNVYTDSQSLIWFPRALELAPGDSRIIRVGVRATPALQEQTFTVFLEEVPISAPQTEKTPGAQVRLVLSVSVPVFVPPAKPRTGGAVAMAELRRGTLIAVIANDGNQHFSYREAAIVGIGADGTERFAERVRGRTLLAGSRERIEVRVPQDACRQLREIALTLVATGPPEIKRRLDVSRADCE